MILIWKCGTWCWDVDSPNYFHKGDHYARLLVPSGMLDDEITDQVIAYLIGDANDLVRLNRGLGC